jgi:hypothetical protein
MKTHLKNTISEILKERFKISNPFLAAFKAPSDFRNKEVIIKHSRGNVRLLQGKVWTQKDFESYRSKVIGKRIP